MTKAQDIAYSTPGKIIGKIVLTISSSGHRFRARADQPRMGGIATVSGIR